MTENISRDHTVKSQDLSPDRKVYAETYRGMSGFWDVNMPNYAVAEKLSGRAQSMGFHFEKAGITVPVNRDETSQAAGLLSVTLQSPMISRIPHFFVSVRPPAQDSPRPGIVGRMFTTPEDEPDGRRASIARELLKDTPILFLDAPPYCQYEPFKNSDLVYIWFVNKLLHRNNHIERDIPVTAMNIHILAGIGQTAGIGRVDDMEIVPDIRPIRHGSVVVDLTRIILSLQMWKDGNFAEPFYLISTARLKNDVPTSPPQAYLLDRLMRKLDFRAEWLGLCAARVGALRDHDTGAMLVEIKPEEYGKSLDRLRIVFNEAVDRMVSAPENSGLF